MELVVGTYEELVLGYSLSINEKDYKLKQSFTDHSHVGSVRAIACSPRGVVASGGADEIIRLLNLRSRTELGTLLQHEGTICRLSFFGKTHMFSCSEDGSVCVWNTRSWECLRSLHGHKGPVYDVAVHPSGKLGLSISKDKTLRTWNLITGRRAYITNIHQVADKVLWAPTGDMYIVVTGKQIDIFKVETGSIFKTIQSTFKIHAVDFIQDDVMVVGGEGGNISLYDMTTAEETYSFSTDTVRVKGIACCDPVSSQLCDSTTDNSSKWLVTGSSDGFIKIWNIIKQDEWSHTLVAEIDTGFRILCIALYLPSKTSTNKSVKCKVESSNSDTADTDHDEPMEVEILKKKKKLKSKKNSSTEPEIDEVKMVAVKVEDTSSKSVKCKEESSNSDTADTDHDEHMEEEIPKKKKKLKSKTKPSTKPELDEAKKTVVKAKKKKVPTATLR